MRKSGGRTLWEDVRCTENWKLTGFKITHYDSFTDNIIRDWIGPKWCVAYLSLNSFSTRRLAVHLSQNNTKRLQNAKNKKCIAGYFSSLFLRFVSFFSYIAPGSIFTRNVKGFHSSFFRSINETWYLNEKW